MSTQLLLALAAGAVIALAYAVLRRTGLRFDMPALDRAAWETADSLTEVAALTARWLAGELRAQPGYLGAVDVDEDDAPGLTAALIACNRAGFLTTGSQAGDDDPDANDHHWTQLASVEGLITEPALSRLRAALAGTGIEVDASGRGLVVTRMDGRPVTRFGARRRRRELADDWTGYGMCGPTAVAELVAAHPVVVYDPEPGRNDRLWPALTRAAAALRPEGDRS